MSYGIQLYDPTFLRCAIAEDLGDWTDAPNFSVHVLITVRDWLQAKGYVLESERVGYSEWVYPNEKWGLQVSVFSCEIAFSIPYWHDADSAIELARNHARELATLTQLGYYDQQTGETLTN